MFLPADSVKTFTIFTIWQELLISKELSYKHLSLKPYSIREPYMTSFKHAVSLAENAGGRNIS